MAVPLAIGATVAIPWGLDEVTGTVVEVYGTEPRMQVVVELTPALSGEVVDAPTTVAVPLSAVRRADPHEAAQARAR